MSEIPPETSSKPESPAKHHPHAVRAGTIGFGALFLLVALNWAAIHFGLVKVPPNTIPWDRPVLDARPGLFAHWQMQRLKTDHEMCRIALDHARDLSYTPLADMSTDGDCGFTDVVRATKTPIPFNIAPVTTCSLSAALYWWQRDVQRLSRQILKTKIRRIDQLGTYACRNINGAVTGARSEHATANAIDIEGFETEDGRRITVKNDWLKPTPEGRFLRAAHDSACGVFGEVLGPDYNSLHANHFHLDEAAWTMCR
ncbi:MAG: extensin-like domain-containing protein [Rhizomicrobium sp.]